MQLEPAFESDVLVADGDRSASPTRCSPPPPTRGGSDRATDVAPAAWRPGRQPEQRARHMALAATGLTRPSLTNSRRGGPRPRSRLHGNGRRTDGTGKRAHIHRCAAGPAAADGRRGPARFAAGETVRARRLLEGAVGGRRGRRTSRRGAHRARGLRLYEGEQRAQRRLRRSLEGAGGRGCPGRTPAGSWRARSCSCARTSKRAARRAAGSPRSSEPRPVGNCVRTASIGPAPGRHRKSTAGALEEAESYGEPSDAHPVIAARASTAHDAAVDRRRSSGDAAAEPARAGDACGDEASLPLTSPKER